MKLEYTSNNSGGGWWLKDADWHAMEACGWKVEWERDRDGGFFKADADGRWLGALARRATIEVRNREDAKVKIRAWETITGQDASDEGCNCCGAPHSFTLEDDDGEYLGNAIEVHRSSSWE